MTTTSARRALAARFFALARAHGLPAALAEKMIDVHTEHMAAERRRHRALIEHWGRTAKADPAFTANLALARRAVDHFGGARLRQVFEQTGLGSHPELIRAFAKIGKILPKTRRPARPPDFAAREKTLRLLYPTMYKDK